MEFIKRYPVPIAGLVLALFILGDAVGYYGEWLRLVIGAVALVLYLPYLGRLAFLRQDPKGPLEDPVTASRLPAITMATLFLAGYAARCSSALGAGIWYAGLGGHILFLLWFSYKFVLRGFSVRNVYPSWFTVYTGIAAASVTAPAAGNLDIGQGVFWFALGAFIVVLPFASWRVWKIRRLPGNAVTTPVIFAMPVSLLMAGYTAAFETRIPRLTSMLLLFSSVFYLIGLGYYIWFTWKHPDFTPDHADFAFPIATSALSSRLTASTASVALETSSLLAAMEAVFASLIVAGLLIRYLLLLRSIWKKTGKRSSLSR